MHLLEDIEYGPKQGIKEKLARCGIHGKNISANEDPNEVTCEMCCEHIHDDKIKQLETTILHRLEDIEGIKKQIASYRRELKELRKE